MRPSSFPSNRFVFHRLSLVLLAFSGLSLNGCDKGESPAAASGQQSTPSSQEATANSTARTKPRGNTGGLIQAQTQNQSAEAPSAAELPPIQMNPPLLDFGFIPPNTEVEGSVKLTNTSTQPITILAVQPTCKCTTLNKLAGTVVPAGEAVDLQAAMDGGPNPGPKTASVKVLVDGFARPLEIDLKAEISLPIRAIPPYINAVREQNKRGRIVIESITGKPFRICSIHGKTPNLMNFDPATDEPLSKYIFSYDLAEIDVPYPRYLVVATDDPDVPVVDIYLRHETTMPAINRNLRVAEGFRHPFGRIDKGGSTEMEIGFQDLREPVATVISGSKDARVELLGSRTKNVGDTVQTIYNIKVVPARDFQGVLYFPITFLTNSGESADVPVFGVVIPEGESCLYLLDPPAQEQPDTPAG